MFSQTSKDNITQKVADTTVIKKPEKLKFGCGFGLNFVGGTNISVSPNLTHTISDKIAVGGGLQGSYAAIKNLQNTTTFGANVLGRYNPVKKITTLLEFSELRVSTKKDSPTEKSTYNYWDSALFVGAGYNVTSKISFGAKYAYIRGSEILVTNELLSFTSFCTITLPSVGFVLYSLISS